MFIVVNDIVVVLKEMGKETNKQVETIKVDVSSNRFKTNYVDVSLGPNDIKSKT